MSIVSSNIIEDAPAIGARRSILERHVDNIGISYDIRYITPTGIWNAATALAARAISLAAGILADEIQANLIAISTLGSLATPKFNYSTVAANVAALRVFYVTATRDEAIFTGDYLQSLTDVQLENAFGMTQGQVTTLRTNKLIPASNLAASIRAAAGQ